MAGKLVHFELPAQDVERASRFYGSLFGWQLQNSGMPGLDYRMVHGDPGGAVYAGEGDAHGPVVYFDTDDIDTDVARVRELGGEAENKAPIPGVGWFARCSDTEGNPFSLFESDESVTQNA